MDYHIPLQIVHEGCNILTVFPSFPPIQHQTDNFSPELSQLNLQYVPETVVDFKNLTNRTVSTRYKSSPLVKSEGNCALVFVLFLNFPEAVSSALILNTMLTRETIYFLLFSTQNLRNANFDLFQSREFERAHPNLVHASKEELKQSSNLGVTWTFHPICYLCPTLTDKVIILSKTLPLKASQILTTMKKLTSTGYGKLALVDGLGDNRTHFIRSLEVAMKTNWTIGYTVKVLLGIISDKLNFTIANPSPTTSIRTPRLSVCNHCEPGLPSDPSTLPESRYGHNIMHVNEESFFYCTSTVSLHTANAYSFLLTPFDTWIWSAILGTILLTGVVYRSPWFSLNIVWGLLGIPYLRGWSQIKILVIVSLALLIPQWYYVAFFTSDIILPFQPIQLDSIKELFTSGGYKLARTVCDSSDGWDSYVRRNNNSFIRFKLNPSPENFLILDSACSGEGYERSGKFVGKAVAIIQTKFTKLTATKVQKLYPGYYCNVVKEPWDVVTVTMNYDSHLSPAFGDLLDHLQAGGIDVYYEKIFMGGAQREAMSGTGRGSGVSASGHLFSLFKLCGIMFIFCAGTLFGEILLTRRFRWMLCKYIICQHYRRLISEIG